MFGAVFSNAEPRATVRGLYGALVFVTGLQMIRFLFGSITWYLRDTIGISTLDLIPIALAPFLAGALLPVVSRWIGARLSLWVGTLVLIAARLVNQVAASPAVDIWAAGVATAALVGLLPLLLSQGRDALVSGLLLGLAIDSAIRGLGLSLDLAYQSGVGPLVGVLGLSVLCLYTLRLLPSGERQGASWAGGGLMLGIGPLLFFELLVLQNQGWTSEVGGMSGAQTQLRIALLNVLALIVVARRERSRALGAFALVSLIAAAVLAEAGAVPFNVATVAAIPAAGLVWSSLVPDIDRRGLAASSMFLVGGMVIFVVLGLVYYVPMDIDLGFTQAQARLGAALLLGVVGLAGLASRFRSQAGGNGQVWAFAALAAVLPLIGLLSVSSSEAVESSDPTSVRVMSYNIHSSFSTAGVFDIEEIARIIEDSGAEVVGLQEVPRGRLLSGVSDQMTLLASRLGFAHVAFFGTTDPTWGNAILSRYPITSVEKSYLPLAGTLLQRGYLAAEVSLGGGRSLLFITTHLQHINDSSAHAEDPEADLYPVHHEQLNVLITQWGGRAPAILTGDFNARPGWRQVDELLAAGWVDSWDEAGVGEGFTSNAANPRHRIDYVFHTADLVALDAGVILSQASDHFAVVVDVTSP